MWGFGKGQPMYGLQEGARRRHADVGIGGEHPAWSDCGGVFSTCPALAYPAEKCDVRKKVRRA
jgi:hypothetical protein